MCTKFITYIWSLVELPLLLQRTVTLGESPWNKKGTNWNRKHQLKTETSFCHAPSEQFYSPQFSLWWGSFSKWRILVMATSAEKRLVGCPSHVKAREKDRASIANSHKQKLIWVSGQAVSAVEKLFKSTSECLWEQHSTWLHKNTTAWEQFKMAAKLITQRGTCNA